MVYLDETSLVTIARRSPEDVLEDINNGCNTTSLRYLDPDLLLSVAQLARQRGQRAAVLAAGFALVNYSSLSIDHLKRLLNLTMLYWETGLYTHVANVLDTIKGMSAEVGSVSHTQELAAFQGVTGRRRQITDEYIEPELTGTRSLTPSYHHYSGPSHDSTETSHIDDARRLGFIAASSPQPGRNYNVTKPGDLLDFDALGSRSSSSQLFKDLRSHPRDDHSARDGHSADTEAVLQAQHNIDMQYNGQGEVAEEVPERYIGDRTPSTSSDAEGDSPGVSIGLQPGGSACSDIASHASPALEMLTESKSIVGSAATSEESSQTKRKIVKKGGKRKRRLTTAKSTGRTTRHAFAQIAARSSTKRSKEEYTDLKGKDTPEEALGKLGCSFGQEPDVSKDSKKALFTRR